VGSSAKPSFFGFASERQQLLQVLKLLLFHLRVFGETLQDHRIHLCNVGEKHLDLFAADAVKLAGCVRAASLVFPDDETDTDPEYDQQ